MLNNISQNCDVGDPSDNSYAELIRSYDKKLPLICHVRYNALSGSK